MRQHIIQEIEKHKLIAIIRGMGAETMLQLAQALYEGGIRLMEVTFDPAAQVHTNTTKSIALIKNAFPDVLVGAGTVLTEEMVQLAHDAGAGYIISPDVNEAVIKKTRALGMVSLPGAMTASECMQAHRAGADFIKLFPAGSLGTGYLKALRAPLKQLKFLAVGGIHENNIQEFLKAGALGAGVGGNLVNGEWIKNGEFYKITALAKNYVERVGTL